VLAVVLIALAAAGAYHRTFSNAFSWDDGYLVLDNQAITDLARVPRLFAEPWAGGVGYGLGQQQNRAYYRPMALASMALDWAIAGPDPLVFHASSLLLHVLTALLILAWLRSVVAAVPAGRGGAGGEICTCSISAGSAVIPLVPWPAVIALLWVLHPVHTEAVDVVSYRTTLLQGLFVFATLVALAPARPGPVRIASGVLAFAAGLLSKETALVAPGLLVLQDAFLGRVSWRRTATVWLPLVAVAGAWWVLRSYLVGGGVYEYFAGLTPLQGVLMVPRIVFLYARLALLPHPLCPFYDWWILGVPSSPLEPDILAGIVVLVALPVAAVLLRRRAPRASFGLAFFLVALLPVSHLVPFFDAAGERFLYVPVAGLLVAAWGAGASLPPSRLLSRVAIGLAALAVVSFGGLTAMRTAEWKDSETILRATARDFPVSVSAQLGLGRLMLDQDRPAEAIEPLAQVVRLAPSLPVGHALLAVSQARAGRFSDARATLHAAPLPERGLPSAAQIARNELLKRGETALLEKIGM
jgi:hypothetical protein